MAGRDRCVRNTLAELGIKLHTCVVSAFRISEELAVSEASSRGVSRLVRDARDSGPVVITSHNQAVAAVVGMGDLAAVEQTLEDLADLALVVARACSEAGGRTGMDEVLAAFGHTRRSLAAVPDE